MRPADIDRGFFVRGRSKITLPKIFTDCFLYCFSFCSFVFLKTFLPFFVRFFLPRLAIGITLEVKEVFAQFVVLYLMLSVLNIIA